MKVYKIFGFAVAAFSLKKATPAELTLLEASAAFCREFRWHEKAVKQMAERMELIASKSRKSRELGENIRECYKELTEHEISNMAARANQLHAEVMQELIKI